MIREAFIALVASLIVLLGSDRPDQGHARTAPHQKKKITVTPARR